MTIAVVDELGHDVERAWRAVSYERSAFPALSGELLAAARLPERLDPDDVVRAVFRGELPQQADPLAKFGQPPVTLFRGRRFYVDALFWVDGTTAIHDHAFSGAFQVLSGESIETTYSFAEERDVDGHLQWGQLSVGASALRRKGDVRPIAAGPSYIHALFHLVRPSVSLVVRTFDDAAHATQFEYSPAGLRFDSFQPDQTRDRIVQIVEMLRRTESAALESHLGDLVAGADLGTAFALLRWCVRLADLGMIDRVLTRLPDRPAADRIRDWIAHRKRIELLISRRAQVREPHLRFFLAVLLNAPRRAHALALTASYAPGGAPALRIAAWLAELSRITLKLQVGNAPFEPNILGLPLLDSTQEALVARALTEGEETFTAEERALIARLRGLPPLLPLFS